MWRKKEDDGDEDHVYVSPISSRTLRGVSASCEDGREKPHIKTRKRSQEMETD